MSIRLKHCLPALFQLSAVTFAASPALAAWQSNVNYGGTLKMDLYTPSTVAASPGVVVAIHFCTGNAGSTHGWFQSLADKYGFYIISPDAGKQCFDSSASRDGDKDAIVKMVQYVIKEKKADATRVFAAGASSGGCMTNTLLAVYPEVFAAGAAAPGFPAGGWPKGDTTCTKCSSNPPNNTGKQWGDIARSAYAYNGKRPRVQQWVGSNDEYNFDGWLPAVVSQFQDLLGAGQGSTASGPSGWTRTEYKNAEGTVVLQTNVGNGMPHDLTGRVPWAEVVSFFGLDKASTGGTGGTGGASGTGGTAGGGGGKGGSGGAGGVLNSGGNPGGGAGNMGGGSSSGGSAGAPSGGTTSSGGTASGGASSGGATLTAGGTTSTSTGVGGSAPASGGRASSGGSSGMGGTTNGSGGALVGTGGFTATGPGPAPMPDPASCGCHLPGKRSRSTGAILGVIAAGALSLVRRRKRNVR